MEWWSVREETHGQVQDSDAEEGPGSRDGEFRGGPSGWAGLRKSSEDWASVGTEDKEGEGI